MKHILKPAFALFLIAAITTSLLAYVYSLTAAPRENQIIKAKEKTMKLIFPNAVDFTEIFSEKSGSIDRVLESRDRDNIKLGIIAELSPQGYSGNIYMMVGISKTQNRIEGMRIIKHTETPGLGALAVKEKFYRKYENLMPVPLKVVRGTAAGENEIEAITGATITTRAITNAVNEAVEWYNTVYNNNGKEAP